MGLDITYYKLGKRVEVDENIEPFSSEWYQKYGDGPELIRLSNDYDWEQGDDLEEGFYEANHLGSFRAGSYSGYGWFRNTLIHLAKIAMQNAFDKQEELYLKYEEDDNPFELLTHFSDSEGYIGPFTSGHLAGVFNDFEKPIIMDIIKMAKYGVNRDIYDTYSPNSLDTFTMMYRDWKTAFNEVAGIGVVIFQ